MATATLLFERHPGWCGDVNIYALSEPYQGADHIAVERFDSSDGWQNAGTQVVACDATGAITGDTVGALYQSYVVQTHAELLADLGYQAVVG